MAAEILASLQDAMKLSAETPAALGKAAPILPATG
jgi:hypothetical protein